MFSDLHQVQWEPVSATKTCLMFCCFYYKQWEPAFSKNFGPQLEAFKGWPWAWLGMQWTEGVSRISKMSLTHFFRKSAQPGFDVMVLIWISLIIGTFFALVSLKFGMKIGMSDKCLCGPVQWRKAWMTLLVTLSTVYTILAGLPNNFSIIYPSHY